MLAIPMIRSALPATNIAITHSATGFTVLQKYYKVRARGLLIWVGYEHHKSPDWGPDEHIDPIG